MACYISRRERSDPEHIEVDDQSGHGLPEGKDGCFLVVQPSNKNGHFIRLSLTIFRSEAPL